jgi:uncharacterized protein (TIGR03000 family)
MPRQFFAFLMVTALLALPPAEVLAGTEKPATPPGKKSPRDKKLGPQPAVIKVLIPGDARLAVDDSETKATGGERKFVTPPLAPGRTFSYTLTAVWQDGGRRIKRMAIATVQAGEETVVDLRPNSPDGSSSQIIYVPTPKEVVEKMLQMARITRDDVVYDLGCGDARVLVAAAKKYGARGIGIDIDPRRVEEALANVRKAGVEKLVEIRHGDALKVADLGKATVVMTYMLPEFMEKLRPILREELRPGTRIVAHDYAIPGWRAQQTAVVPAPSRIYAHTLYLWVVPAPRKD